MVNGYEQLSLFKTKDTIGKLKGTKAITIRYHNNGDCFWFNTKTRQWVILSQSRTEMVHYCLGSTKHWEWVMPLEDFISYGNAVSIMSPNIDELLK